MSSNSQQDNHSSFEQILGVRFFVGEAEEAVQIGLKGGLVVVPAGAGAGGFAV